MRRRGISLAETLFAVTLASFVLVLVLNLFPSSMLTVRKAERRTQAAALADSWLESRASLPFTVLTVGYAQDAVQTVDGVDYRVHFSVEKYGTEPTAYLRALRVKVGWRDHKVDLEIRRELLKHRLPSEK